MVVEAAEPDAPAATRDIAAVRRLDPEQCGARGDLDVAGDEHVAHPSGDRRRHGDLHLHRLDDAEPIAHRDDVARLDVDADDERRGRRPDDAGIVAGEAVGDAVHLDEVVAALVRRHHGERLVADRQPSPAAAEPLGLHDDSLAVEPDGEAVGTQLAHDDLVGLAAVAQLDRPADRRVGLRAPPLGPAEERRALAGGGERERVEGGHDEGDVGVARRQVAVGGGEPVEPRRVDVAGAHLRPLQQVEQERPVRRAAVDDDGHLRERPVQPGQRFVAVATGGDDLGDHRVVLRRDDIALAHAGVDPDARADRQREDLDRAGRGGERSLRVLGVEAGLDRVALGRRRLALQPASGRDVQLQLDEIEPGRQLGDRVLDLQARVDLEEREALLGGLVQELDGAGVLVAGDAGQAHRRGAQVDGPARASGRCTATPR